MKEEPLLKAVGISKYFPGVQALDRVNFDLKKGEVHALVGENGAGKSTLMNILSGVIQPDEGEISIMGRSVHFRNPLNAGRAGVGIVFQDLSLIRNLSIAENIYAGRQKVNFAGMVDMKDLYERSRQLLESFGEDLDPRTPVKYLSIAKQQVVEILKAISHDPKILILDEPTSSLTHQETGRLFSIIEKLKGEGISIVYISHLLQEIFSIADRATVLRDGQCVSTVPVDSVDEADIIRLMVGRDVTHEHIDRDHLINLSKSILSVKDLSHHSYFRDVSFDVHQGEILGFAGLIGAGRSEVARTIFGLEKKTGGTIFLDGREIDPGSPIEAMSCGIAYTSENRKFDGLFLDMSINENGIAPQMKEFAKRPFGFLDKKRIDKFVDDNIRRFNVQTSSRNAKVRKLSGGNQQKVLLSMWLGIEPRVLIVDEPTKGVDVGAKSEIFNILRELADSGISVIVVSSDLLEIIAISDRVVVMRGGRICGELHHSDITEEKVIAYASGIN